MKEDFKGSIIIADTETTGVKIDTTGVCQLAAVRLTQVSGDWVIQPLFQTYCSPCEPMAAEAMAVHGITPDMYKYAPTDTVATWVLREMIKSIQGPVIMSGYNSTRFDYPLLDKVLPVPGNTFDHMPQIDVMTLMLRLAPEHGLKLTEVFERLINDRDLLDSAHDAMADCWMTALILEQYMRTYPTDPEVLATWCNTPVQMETMPWGKYKGKPFASIPHSYLDWMAKNWDDMHPDLAFSLRAKGLIK